MISTYFYNIIKNEKLDSVSGGGIREYEAMVRQMLAEGYDRDQILQALQNEKASISDPTKFLAV